MPGLGDRFAGSALRVPVPDGSITDLTVVLREPAAAADINAAFRAASADSFRGIIDYSEAPIVSSDVVGNAASCVFDAPLTQSRGRLAKVFGWYDNEWAYSHRLADLAEIIGRQLDASSASSAA